MKNIVIFITVATLFSGAVANAYAGSGGYGSSNCQVVYGGGEVCPPTTSFDINKQVQTTGKGGEFVENLTINDHKFTAGETVTYKITVKNTGKDTIKDLKITDTLPAELDYASSANGKYDSKNRTTTFTVASLAKDKSAEFFITAKVREGSTACPINTVNATDSSRNTAQDTAMICLDRGILTQKGGGPIVQQTPPLKQTPSTGPEMLSLVALIPSGALGIFLKRKSK